MNISAFAIDHHLNGQSIAKEINQAIKSELETSLAGVPSWVQEHVFEFAEALYPLVQAEQKATQAPGNDSPPYVVNMLQEPPAAASERFQDFYAELEQFLRIEESSPARDHPEQGEEEHERQTAISEDTIREILELVEGALCSIFYDRSVARSTALLHDSNSMRFVESTCSQRRTTHHTTRRSPVVSRHSICWISHSSISTFTSTVPVTSSIASSSLVGRVSASVNPNDVSCSFPPFW